MLFRSETVAVKEITTGSTIFNKPGANEVGVRVYDSKNEKWVDLSEVERDKYKDYYISDAYLDNEGDPIEGLKAKHYYQYNEKTNKWGQVDYSYQIENMDKSGAYIMKKIGIVDAKNANYHENKFKFIFNGDGGKITVFTRYKFDTGSTDFAKVLYDNGLLPSSSQNGWVQGTITVIDENGAEKTETVNGTDYKFTEIILFSGNSYNSENPKYVRSYTSALKTDKYKT